MDEPGIIETGWPTTADPEVSRLLDDLHDAKKAGDMDTARAIEDELARLRGERLEFQPTDRALGSGIRTSRPIDDEALAGDRWEADDILIRGSDHGEIKPVIAGDWNGRLFAVNEYLDTNAILISRSLNGGEYWNWWRSLGHPTLDHSNVSLAVAQGNENWVLVAFQMGTTDLRLWRESPDEDDFDTPLIYECPDGLSNPSIVTDASEYSGWYVYVVFNAMTVEGWAVCFSRSLDHGRTWADPEIIGWHCGGWDATESRLDIDFGSRYLYATYSTPVNPCSNENREIYVNRSTDFGATWAGAVRLTTDDDGEFEPAVGAIKNYVTDRTAVIAYTRFYDALDNDVWYVYTQDGGATWNSQRCLSCLVDDNERAPDLETSFSEGALHIAYYHDDMVDYATADYTSPTVWTKQTHINDSLWLSPDYPWPAVCVNPTRPTDEEAGICWTDERNAALKSYEIYYDGPGTVETHAPETGMSATDGLLYCGPNPFTEGTSVSFDLPEASVVKLIVSDVTGRMVRTLAEGRHLAGRHVATWDGLATDGGRVRTGVYFIRLETERAVTTRSATILR